MDEQAGRGTPATDAGRAWIAGTLSSREYFARARSEAWPTRHGRRRPWRDRLRAWRVGQRL